MMAQMVRTKRQIAVENVTEKTHATPSLSIQQPASSSLMPYKRLIPLNDAAYYDVQDVVRELRRVFDICHGCRRCFNLCTLFPRLFDLLDDPAIDGDIDNLSDAQIISVLPECTLCDMCFMVKCPYVPPHPWHVDLPRLILRWRACGHHKTSLQALDSSARQATQNQWERWVDGTLARMDLIGKIGAYMAPVSNFLLKLGWFRLMGQWLAGLSSSADMPPFATKYWWRRRRPLHSAFYPSDKDAVDNALTSGDCARQSCQDQSQSSVTPHKHCAYVLRGKPDGYVKRSPSQDQQAAHQSDQEGAASNALMDTIVSAVDDCIPKEESEQFCKNLDEVTGHVFDQACPCACGDRSSCQCVSKCHTDTTASPCLNDKGLLCAQKSDCFQGGPSDNTELDGNQLTPAIVAWSPPMPRSQGHAYGKEVWLYTTCFHHYYESELMRNACDILAYWGVRVHQVYPGCCGMPLWEQGRVHQVADQARRLAPALAKCGGPIVPATPSCAFMLRQEWPSVCPDDMHVRYVAEKTVDLCEYLTEICPGGGSLPAGVSVHSACHVRAQNRGHAGHRLLQKWSGQSLPLIDRCSGHGGLWGYKHKHFSNAMVMARPVVQQADRGRAEGNPDNQACGQICGQGRCERPKGTCMRGQGSFSDHQDTSFASMTLPRVWPSRAAILATECPLAARHLRQQALALGLENFFVAHPVMLLAHSLRAKARLPWV